MRELPKAVVNSLKYFPSKASLPRRASEEQNQPAQVQNPVDPGYWTQFALHPVKAIFSVYIYRVVSTFKLLYNCIYSILVQTS